MNIDILIYLECIVVVAILVILGITVKFVIKNELTKTRRGTENKHNKNKQINYKVIVEMTDEIIFVKDDEEFHYKKN